MTETNLTLAQRYQEKYLFYMIGLVFTILGLSIQTANFSVSLESSIFELIGWSGLLISGLSGLSRLASTSTYYLKSHYVEQLEAQKKNQFMKLEEMKNAQYLVGIINDNNCEKNYNDICLYVDIGNKKINELNSKLKLRYEVHRWSFIVGIISIIFSRGWLPFKNILNILLA